MKPFQFFLTVSLLCIFSQTSYTQKTPCFKRKKICNFQYLTNCYEKVAFDTASNRYYSRQNLGSFFDGTCTTCHRNGVVEQQITINEGKRNGTDTSYFPSGCPTPRKHLLMALFMVQAQVILIVAIESNQK